MGVNLRVQCARCKQWGVEQIEEWESTQCPSCNDRDIERSNERREFAYYHPTGK